MKYKRGTHGEKAEKLDGRFAGTDTITRLWCNQWAPQVCKRFRTRFFCKQTPE